MTIFSDPPGLVARIHLQRLRENAALLRSHVPGNVRLMGVVKCDAYGHGADVVARVLRECGVTDLVVGSVAEGMALRRANISGPILVLSDPLHARLQDALDHDLTITVADPDVAAALLKCPVSANRPFRVHVKIDTGLARFGLSPGPAPDIIAALSRAAHIRVQGIYSHLSNTFDDDADSNAFTLSQIAVFEGLLNRLEACALLPAEVHLGSSTGLLGFPEVLCSGRYNGLRVGTLLYGFAERPNTWVDRPVPVAEVSTRILQVRDIPAGSWVGYHRSHRMPRNGRIAVIHGGFDHGLHGDLARVLEPLVDGRRTLLVGKPALAQSMIDITSVPEAMVGSAVLLAGQALNMHHVARNIGRGTWELLLPLLKNARRVYLHK